MIFQPIEDKSHMGARAALADGRVVKFKLTSSSTEAIIEPRRHSSSAAAAAASAAAFQNWDVAAHEMSASTWRVSASVLQCRRINKAAESTPFGLGVGLLFDVHENMEQENLNDLATSAEAGELVGLVDESCGGIVGYVIGDAHAHRLVDLLNAAACEPNMKSELDALVKAVGAPVSFVTPAHRALRDAVVAFIGQWDKTSGNVSI